MRPQLLQALECSRVGGMNKHQARTAEGVAATVSATVLEEVVAVRPDAALAHLGRTEFDEAIAGRMRSTRSEPFVRSMTDVVIER